MQQSVSFFLSFFLFFFPCFVFLSSSWKKPFSDACQILWREKYPYSLSFCCIVFVFFSKWHRRKGKVCSIDQLKKAAFGNATHRRTHARTHSHNHKSKHTHIYTHKYTLTCTHKVTHTCTDTHSSSLSLSLSLSHTHTHTRLQTQTHTYTGSASGVVMINELD